MRVVQQLWEGRDTPLGIRALILFFLITVHIFVFYIWHQLTASLKTCQQIPKYFHQVITTTSFGVLLNYLRQ